MTRDGDRVSAWLQLLQRKIERDGNALLRGSGITVMQLRVLKYLKTHPDEPQVADISEFFGVTHTSVVHVVNALEEKGLVLREPIRRSRGKRIVLTEAGRCVANQNEDRIDTLEEAMMEGFSNEERAGLIAAFKRMDTNLDAHFGR